MTQMIFRGEDIERVSEVVLRWIISRKMILGELISGG
jgi:hypothetical protein